jgi:hypothetical protein
MFRHAVIGSPVKHFRRATGHGKAMGKTGWHPQLAPVAGGRHERLSHCPKEAGPSRAARRAWSGNRCPARTTLSLRRDCGIAEGESFPGKGRACLRTVPVRPARHQSGMWVVFAWACSFFKMDGRTASQAYDQHHCNTMPWRRACIRADDASAHGAARNTSPSNPGGLFDGSINDVIVLYS